jgi:adenylate kinase
MPYVLFIVVFFLAGIHAQADETVTVPDERPLVMLLFGPPGSGRDALAVKLSNTVALPYVSCADLLLDQSDDDTELGRKTRECLLAGEPVPDDVIQQLLKKRATQSDMAKGFVLDGFPRNLEQAKLLQDTFSRTHRFFVVSIRVTDDWIISQSEARLVCTECGRVYHLQQSPPQNQAICDFCDSVLVQRDADSQENVKKQCDSYRQRMLPIIKFYTEKGLLVEVSGDRSFEDVLQDLKTLTLSKK